MSVDDALRLRIDWTRCEGRGLCIELLPELLTEDPWGYPLARAGSAEIPVPGPLRDHAARAAEQCPRLALRLTGHATD
jgi:ferredoxin